MEYEEQLEIHERTAIQASIREAVKSALSELSKDKIIVIENLHIVINSARGGGAKVVNGNFVGPEVIYGKKD